MILSLILQNAIPVVIVGYYISALLNFSQTERVSIDLQPRHHRFLRWIIALSPAALTLSAVLCAVVVFARYTEMAH